MSNPNTLLAWLTVIWEIIEDIPSPPAWLAMLAGGLLLVWGYKTYYWVLAVPAWMIGGLIGYWMADRGATGGLEAVALILFVAFVTWLAFLLLHGITVWTVGAVLGLAIFKEIVGLVGLEAATWVTILAAIIGGILLGLTYDRLICVSSALLGSWIISRSAGYDETMILVVAMGGLFAQVIIAKLSGEDVFRRAKKPLTEGTPTQKSNSTATSTGNPFRKNESASNQEVMSWLESLAAADKNKNRPLYEPDPEQGFDPNQEMPTYED